MTNFATEADLDRAFRASDGPVSPWGTILKVGVGTMVGAFLGMILMRYYDRDTDAPAATRPASRPAAAAVDVVPSVRHPAREAPPVAAAAPTLPVQPSGVREPAPSPVSSQPHAAAADSSPPVPAPSTPDAPAPPRSVREAAGAGSAPVPLRAASAGSALPRASVPARERLIAQLRNRIVDNLNSAAASYGDATVIVRASFTPDGYFRSLSLSQSSGHPEFDAFVVSALQRGQPYGVVAASGNAGQYDNLSFLFANQAPSTPPPRISPASPPESPKRVTDIVPPPVGSANVGEVTGKAVESMDGQTADTLSIPEPEAHAAFKKAESRMLSGSYQDARSQFEDVIKRYPESLYAPRAMLRIGEMLARSADRGSALDMWADLVRRYPGSEEAARARRLIAGGR